MLPAAPLCGSHCRDPARDWRSMAKAPRPGKPPSNSIWPAVPRIPGCCKSATAADFHQAAKSGFLDPKQDERLDEPVFPGLMPAWGARGAKQFGIGAA